MLAFLHFHKCAGTTIVEAAKTSGMRLPPNSNGNPTAGGRVIRWSQLSDEDCERRIREYAKEFDLIAFEKDLPSWEVLEKIEGLRWFTVLREPQSRAYSNFRFSRKGQSPKKHLEFGFQSASANADGYLRSNYYTSTLCQTTASAVVTSDHLEFAINRLERFETVGIFEKTPFSKQLLHLGFSPDSFGHHNKTGTRKGQFDFPTAKDFFERNTFDCALYSYFLAKSAT